MDEYKETYKKIWAGIFMIAMMFAVYIGMNITEFDKDVIAKESYEEGYSEGWEDYDENTDTCDYSYLEETDMSFDPEGDDIQVSHARFYLIVALVLFSLFVLYSYRRHDRCVSLFFTPVIMSLILTSIYFEICYIDRSRHLLGRTYWAYFALAWTIGIWAISLIGNTYVSLRDDVLTRYRNQIDILEREIQEKDKTTESKG